MTLTLHQVAHALPPNLKNNVTQQLVDNINNCVSDPIMAEAIKDNFLSYTQVLSEGKFKTEDYLSAVMYVSFKLMGMTNQDAYARTFPARYRTLLNNGTSAKDISSYVSMYNKGRLVNLILEKSLIPTWVLNQHIYQKAINVQADLMSNANSEMVRMQAANSILTHLAKPKEVGPLINLDLREGSGLNELKATLTQLAQQQRDLIGQGVTTKSIADQGLVIDHVDD
jgi:hypothetical protein